MRRTYHSEGSQTAFSKCVTFGVSLGYQTVRRTLHTQNICIPSLRCESNCVSRQWEGLFTLHFGQSYTICLLWVNLCFFRSPDIKKDFSHWASKSLNIFGELVDVQLFSLLCNGFSFTKLFSLLCNEVNMWCSFIELLPAIQL